MRTRQTYNQSAFRTKGPRNSSVSSLPSESRGKLNKAMVSDTTNVMAKGPVILLQITKSDYFVV